MIIRACTLFISLFVTSNAFAGWISADDMALGTSPGTIDGVSFGWEKKLSSEDAQDSAATIVNSQGYSHNHFGGASLYSTGLVGSPWIENLYIQDALGAATRAAYTALELTFTEQPITAFSFKAEWKSGSPIGLLAYDESGIFQKAIQFSASTPRLEDSTYNQEFHAAFDFNVGSIKLGSMSDAAYIYAVNATVPEPSSLILIFSGLLALVFRRNRIQR